MILAFELSMPSANSWNGRWSGEGRVYAVLKSYKSQRSADHARRLIGYHRYSWTDGWAAAITVREVDSAEARKLRKATVGFAGYEWMIASLEQYGKIYADHERPALAEPVA